MSIDEYGDALDRSGRVIEELSRELATERAAREATEEQRDWHAAIAKELLPYQKRAVDAEARNARLVEAIERLAAEWEERAAIQQTPLPGAADVSDWSNGAGYAANRCADELRALVAAGGEAK